MGAKDKNQGMLLGSITKRKVKDSVFTDLFRNKKYLLQLYQTLHPEDKEVTENELEDVTIKHIMVDGDYNDLGFSVGNRLLVLVESQSTWSYNIIIRALMYMMQTYHDYFQRTGQNLSGSKKVTLPKPELYVIFTGERKVIPDILTLSQEFFEGEDVAIEAKVKVLYEESEDIIGQYIIFCKVYNEQRKKFGRTEKTINETIRICMNRNVLKDYLESHKREVISIMMTLFEEEQIMKAYTKDILEQGIEQGIEQGRILQLIKLVESGDITVERAAQKAGMTVEEFKEKARYIDVNFHDD